MKVKRIVANIAVGYNNFDIAACTARGVLATNEMLVERTVDGRTEIIVVEAKGGGQAEPVAERAPAGGEVGVERHGEAAEVHTRSAIRPGANAWPQ